MSACNDEGLTSCACHFPSSSSCLPNTSLDGEDYDIQEELMLNFMEILNLNEKHFRIVAGSFLFLLPTSLIMLLGFIFFTKR